MGVSGAVVLMDRRVWSREVCDCGSPGSDLGRPMADVLLRMLQNDEQGERCVVCKHAVE